MSRQPVHSLEWYVSGHLPFPAILPAAHADFPESALRHPVNRPRIRSGQYFCRCGESVRLKDFAHQNFISLSGSRSIRSICDRYCQHAGFTPNIIFESDSPDTVKNLIAGGLGVGFWPHYTWGQENMDQIVLLPISEPTCQRDLVVHLHRHAVEHAEAVDFFQFLSRYLLELKGQKQK